MIVQFLQSTRMPKFDRKSAPSRGCVVSARTNDHRKERRRVLMAISIEASP